MPTIRDRGINSIVSALEAQRKTNPNVQIDDSNVLKILAAVGDGSKYSGARLATELAKPGMTRQQQVDLVKAGMTESEKADLVTLLDKGSTVPLSASARGFLEAVVGRTAPTGDLTNPLKISLNPDQSGGLTGVAGANVTIEAINLTTAPGGRLHTDDTMVIGKTDASGKFTGKLPDMQAGDVIRMRARDASGKVGEWVTVKANMNGTRDTRGAVLAIFRVGLTDAGNGKIAVSNINEGRQISEPGARVQFTNARTGEKAVITLNSDGTFPAGATLNGKPGDKFTLAATDGTNNTAFTVSAGEVAVPGGEVGKVGVDIADPALHHDELDSAGKPRFSLKRFSGPLFKDGAKPTDVQQGQIGDCYFPAASAAMAQANPEALMKAFKDNGDGTYTVTFKEKDWSNNRYRDVPIKVDGDLYVRSYGGPLYGATLGYDKGEKTMELWFPLLEKAYAQWKGSYDRIGNGGLASDVMEAVLGVPGVERSIPYASPDAIFADVKKAVDNHWPIAAGTYGDDKESLYTNTGVYADHAYSILGYKETNGQKYVTLRNPWGESEPSGDGHNDGIFDMKLEDFTKLYQTLMTAHN